MPLRYSITEVISSISSGFGSLPWEYFIPLSPIIAQPSLQYKQQKVFYGSRYCPLTMSNMAPCTSIA